MKTAVSRDIHLSKELLAVHAHIVGQAGLNPEYIRCRVEKSGFGGAKARTVVFYAAPTGRAEEVVFHRWHIDEVWPDPAEQVADMIRDEAAMENIRRAEVYNRLRDLMRSAQIRIDH